MRLWVEGVGQIVDCRKEVPLALQEDNPEGEGQTEWESRGDR